MKKRIGFFLILILCLTACRGEGVPESQQAYSSWGWKKSYIMDATIFLPEEGTSLDLVDGFFYISPGRSFCIYVNVAENNNSVPNGINNSGLFEEADRLFKDKINLFASGELSSKLNILAEEVPFGPGRGRSGYFKDDLRKTQYPCLIRYFVSPSEKGERLVFLYAYALKEEAVGAMEEAMSSIIRESQNVGS